MAAAPFESYGDDALPAGVDMDLIAEMAARLGLSRSVNVVSFGNIAVEVTSRHCDIAVSVLNYSVVQRRSLRIVPTMESGQAFVIPAGNPSGIKGTLDICGLTVGARKNSIEYWHLAGGNTYNIALGLKPNCEAAGRKLPTINVYRSDAGALAALVSGKIAAFMTDWPLAGYYAAQNPTLAALWPMVLEKSTRGFAVSNRSFELEGALRQALGSMIADGTYIQILKKYGMEAAALPKLAVLPTPAPSFPAMPITPSPPASPSSLTSPSSSAPASASPPVSPSPS